MLTVVGVPEKDVKLLCHVRTLLNNSAPIRTYRTVCVFYGRSEDILQRDHCYTLVRQENTKPSTVTLWVA